MLIGGIIVRPGESPGTKTLVRAIGPSLGAHGVKGALADPTLSLHNSNGATIASNEARKGTFIAKRTAKIDKGISRYSMKYCDE